VNDLVITIGPKIGHSEEFLEWLRHHDIVPNDCFRLEVYAQDCVAYLYARDPDGKKYTEKLKDGRLRVVQRDPVRFERKYPIPGIGF
jgi:hypothetical protein